MKMCCLALFISNMVPQTPATCLGQPANSHRPQGEVAQRIHHWSGIQRSQNRLQSHVRVPCHLPRIPCNAVVAWTCSAHAKVTGVHLCTSDFPVGTHIGPNLLFDAILWNILQHHNLGSILGRHVIELLMGLVHWVLLHHHVSHLRKRCAWST